MNLTLSDIYFSKSEITLYDEMFAKLDSANRGFIPVAVLTQLLSHLRIDPDGQNQILTSSSVFRSNANCFELKDFYIVIRFAAIIYTGSSINKSNVCQFETPALFIETLSESVRRIATLEKGIVLPPPPPAPLKSKLKRVHTIPGTGSSNEATNAKVSPPPPPAAASLSSALNCLDCNSRPTATQSANEMDELEVFNFWTITGEQKAYYLKQFLLLTSDHYSTIKGNIAKVFFEKSALPVSELSSIWKLSDIDKDGALSLPEFCIAMHLVVLRRNGIQLPSAIPEALLEIFQSLTSDGLEFKIQQMDLCKHSEALLNSGSKKWTQFNDSPVPFTTSATTTSPTHLVNFDYNVESIVRDPHIKHPVPVRLSPNSPSISTFEQAKCSKESLQSFVISTDNSFHPCVRKDSMRESWPLDSDDLNWPNGPTEHTVDSRDVLEYLNGVKDNLLYRYKLPNEISVPEDQLDQTIADLKDYGRALRKNNQQMFNQIISLVKIIYNLVAMKQPTVCFNQTVAGGGGGGGGLSPTEKKF